MADRGGSRMDFVPFVDYGSTASPADEGMPLGRLRALCPQGQFRDQSAAAVVRALLTKKRRRNAVTLHDVDLLAARGMRNTALSPLCRLPDDVLVRIMGHLDWLDMLCIRRTSRIFLRLFGRAELSHLHDNTGRFNLPTPWTSPALPDHDFILWVKMRDRLACEVDHPTCLFSAAQRKKDVAGRRVCVAHEGHVRLCRHKTVKLSTVLDSLPGRRIDNNYRNGIGQPGFSSSSGPAGNSPFSPEPDLRIVCTHPSHIPDHHQRGLCNNANECVNAGSPIPPPMPPVSSPPPYERFPADEHSEFPSFIVHDMMAYGTKHKAITWSYTAHMDLSGLGDPNNGDAITAQAFRDRLHDLRKAHSPARYIAPEDHPGILQELRCVDPNRCGCLVYPGFPRREQEPERRADGRQNGGRAATSDSRGVRCQDHQVVRTLVSRASDLDNIRVRLASCDRHDETRCLKVIYTRTIRLQGFYVHPAPNWAPGLKHGNRRPQRNLHLRLVDSFRGKSVPYGWYQALDPRSYSLTKDTNKYQQTWCRGKRCKLNTSFLREAYVTFQEMNAACRFGCKNAPGISSLGLVLVPQRNLLAFEIPNKEQWDQWKQLTTRLYDPDDPSLPFVPDFSSVSFAWPSPRRRQ